MLQIEKSKTCCFITDDSEKYTASLDDVRGYLEKKIIKAMEEEKTCFISGMSNQIDMWISSIILELKVKYKELKLICAIPYFGYEKQMDLFQKCLYRCIISDADKVFYISEEDNNSSLELKDKWMIEHSSKTIKIKLP